MKARLKTVSEQDKAIIKDLVTEMVDLTIRNVKWMFETEDDLDIVVIMREYHQALIEGKKEGYTPLIIIPSEIMLEIIDDTSEVRREYNDDRKLIISKAKDIVVEDFLKRRLDESMQDFDINEITGEFHGGERMTILLQLKVC